MALPLYLAVTEEDFFTQSLPKSHLAWMACEFSPLDAGLSNLPFALPPESMVIVSDAQPLQGHNPDIILSQLQTLIAQQPCNGILLDFQRTYDPEIQHLAAQIAACLPCPVGVSHKYAKELDCPAFLPPVPLNQSPEDYFLPWAGREIWLDVTLDALEIFVTSQGSFFVPSVFSPPKAPVFTNQRLHCCYHTAVNKENVCFTLYRTHETLNSLLNVAEKQGVTRCIGLYRELTDWA